MHEELDVAELEMGVSLVAVSLPFVPLVILSPRDLFSSSDSSTKSSDEHLLSIFWGVLVAELRLEESSCLDECGTEENHWQNKTSQEGRTL